MLTKEERAFVDYWKVQRTRRKSFASGMSSGLPLGVGIVLALFVAIATGWHEQAEAVIRTHGSVILVVILAALGIVVFMSIFSAHHEWDQNEERYQVLIKREDREATS